MQPHAFLDLKVCVKSFEIQALQVKKRNWIKSAFCLKPELQTGSEWINVG